MKTRDGEQTEPGLRGDASWLVVVVRAIPEKYIALVQPGDATEQRIVDVTTAQSPGQQPPISV